MKTLLFFEAVSTHRTLRNLPFLLFLFVILAYGGSFAWYMLAHFDLVNLVRDMNRDDAYYYFQIARNLAEGKFSTFDGGITRTNGYHPVWMLLLTPFYYLFDPETALFGIKAFEIMLVAGGVALIVLATRLAHLPWFLLFAALPMLYRAPYQALIGGMEAAIALFVLGLLFLVLILFARNPVRWQWPLTVTVFVLPWVRLEYIAISLVTTAALCLIEWSRKEKPLGSSLSGLVRLKPVVPLLASCVAILAYFAYNGLVFGGIVPVSGATKLHWSQDWWSGEGGYSFVQNFQDIMRRLVVGPRELLVALEASIYFLFVWYFSRRSRNREDWLLLAFLVGVFSLATQHLAKIAQTVLTMHPVLTSYSEWYYVPAYLMMTLIVPVRCYVGLYFIRRFFAPNRAAYRISRASVLVIAAIFMLYNTSFIYPYRFVDNKKQSLFINPSWIMSSYQGVQVANRVLPEGSIVGSWDAGLVGYFLSPVVVNLDGLVNSYEYLRAPDHLPFHRNWGITHYANAHYLEQNFEHTLFEGASFTTNRKRTFRIYHAKPPQAPLSEIGYARQLWERMQPHFDYRINEVGVVIDGRLVQTFPKDCASIRDKLMVFSWTDHKGRNDLHILDPEKSAREGQAVFCTSAFLLPQDVRHPIDVEMMLKNDYIAELTGNGPPPNIRSNYDVYRKGNNLIYVKKPCSEKEDTGSRFFLRAFPVDPSILLHQYNFDLLDFNFSEYGYEAGETCVVIRDLPRYPIATIRTGQFVPGSHVVWSGDFDLTWQVEAQNNSTPSNNSIRHRHGNLYNGERFLGRFENGFDDWQLDGDGVTAMGVDTDQQPISGNVGPGFLNTYHPRRRDGAIGTARSSEFTATDSQLLAFLIAGGKGDGVGVRLLADGAEVGVWRGRNTEHFELIVHPLDNLTGKTLQLELFDNEFGDWGHIMCDHVMLLRRTIE